MTHLVSSTAKQHKIKVVPTTGDMLPGLLEILVEHGLDNYFPDSAGAKNDIDWFEDWWLDNVWDSLTGLMDGKPVGCGYLTDIKTDKYATIGIFKKKGLLETLEVAQIFRDYLGGFFEKFNLKRIRGLVRVGNTACQAIYEAIGFREDYIIERHNKVRGEWQDYIVVAMSRRDYYGR